MSDTEKPQITRVNPDGPALAAGAGYLSLDSGSHEWLRTGGCDDRFDTTVVILHGIMTAL